MHKLIVGGTFDREGGRPSGVISKLAKELDIEHVINGGNIEHLSNSKYVNKGKECPCCGEGIKIITPFDAFDLIIWMPNISNEEGKIYPRKKRGATLICSKVIRENRNEFDAVARIFKMHANAVIAVHSTDNPFTFQLLDALGNEWGSTSNINELSINIKSFLEWNFKTVRVGTNKAETTYALDFSKLDELAEINRNIADKIENSSGNRFFGNVSTRCSKLFPSTRMEGDLILVSKRNIDKRRITSDDFVLVDHISEGQKYSSVSQLVYWSKGNHKPSVDTPIQMKLYSEFPNINFMIHGHAYIKEAKMSKYYFSCGDFREAYYLEEYIKKGGTGYINLRNHGFLLYSNSIEELRELSESLTFNNRTVGEKIKVYNIL